MTTHTLGKWTTATYVGTSPSGKTDLWEIQSAANGEFLGMIRWYGRWRQYVFHPAKQTIWNPDCLDEVSTFCRGRTKASAEARTVGHSA
jgi:hypothetical protein